MVRDPFDDFRSTAKVRSSLFEGYNVDSLADAVDVALVGGIPETGVVSEMGLAGKQHF